MAKKKATRGQLAKNLGLGSVIRPSTKDTISKIDISKIVADPNQPRKFFDEETLKELSDSIQVHGLIQPITVRDMKNGTFQIISGERRWRASKDLLGLKEIPAYIRVVTPREVKEMALVENIQRDNLNPVEMANALFMLKEEFELTDEDIAKRIGKKRSTVSGYLGILRLSETVKEGLDDGSISMGHAKALLGLEGTETRDKYYTYTIDNNWSVRALENAIREEKESLGAAPKVAKPKSSLPTEYEKVLDDLRARFGSKKINIKLKPDGKGQIVLPFGDTDELNRFLDTIEGE